MKLLVIDGNSIVNRAFFGMHPLNNREGFLNILRRMEEEVDPDGVCVTFDRKEPTFRHLAYADYKAQRKGMPEELAVQMPVLKEVLDAMNIPCYELAGWEADDLIGTISRRCEAAGWDCRVATGDKDSIPTWNWLPPAWERPPPRRWTPARFGRPTALPRPRWWT